VVLSEAELQSGDLIYFTDFIAPYGHTRKIAHDIKHNVFPGSAGKSLRFTEQGKLKRIFTFHGVNYKKPLN
jgi:cytolysin-activating lysine-acyltransferase